MAQMQQSGIILKAGVSYNRLMFFGTTAQTLTVNLSKAGAAFAAGAGSVTEIANGWYKYGLTGGDTNTPGDLAYHVTASSGGPLDFADQVQSQIFTDLALNANGQALIGSNIKQGQPWNGFMFVMTVGNPPVPTAGLTVTAQRNLAGAGFSPCANSPTDQGNGIYSINFAGSDTNAAFVIFRFTASGANDLDYLAITQP